MYVRHVVSVLAVTLLVGCANMATISRHSDLPGGGTAIHLDAAQRLVYSSNGVLCAEPTPDALQSLAASTSVGLSQPTEGAVSLANAFQANAASIGLHTQSITLMRDVLYRICEQSSNKMLVRGDVVQLLERSQDLTLGVLAIEQLTGAVVARQVLLTGETNASASANIANTQAQLDRAQKTEDDKKAAAGKANDDKSAAHAALDKSNAAVAGAGKATPPVAQADLDKLTAQQKSDKAAADEADAAAKSAASDYATAQKATQAIRDNLNAAITAASAAAKGSGSFAPDDSGRNNVNKDTIADIAKATLKIVKTITNKGHLLDTCMNLMVAYTEQTKTGAEKAGLLSGPYEQCVKIIAVYLDKVASGGVITPFDDKVPLPSLRLKQ
jgi:hypothetical protein